MQINSTSTETVTPKTQVQTQTQTQTQAPATKTKTTEEVLKSSREFLLNNKLKPSERAYDVKIESQSSKTGRTIEEKTTAVNALQTADEGMKKTEDTLKKMQEIVEKATDKNLTTDDRNKLQKQYDDLQKELDKTSESTNYNGHKLLDGKFELETNTSNNSRKNREISIGGMSADSLGVSKVSLASPEAAAEASKKLKTATETVAAERKAVKKETETLQQEVSDLNTIKKYTTAKQKGLEDFTKIDSATDYEEAFKKLKEDMLKSVFNSNTSMFSFNASRIATLLG